MGCDMGMALCAGLITVLPATEETGTRGNGTASASCPTTRKALVATEDNGVAIEEQDMVACIMQVVTFMRVAGIKM